MTGMRIFTLMRLLSLAGMVVVAGCCSTVLVRDRPGGVTAAPGVKIETAPLAEALLSHEKGVSVEAVEVTWKDKVFTAEMVVKGNGEKLTVVLLAPQMRLATLTLTRPCKLEWKRAPRVPGSLAPEYALVDIAFVRLPSRVLEAALGEGFSVKDDGRRRVMTYNGRELRVLERGSGEEKKFTNVSAGYSCKIIPMETE